MKQFFFIEIDYDFVEFSAEYVKNAVLNQLINVDSCDDVKIAVKQVKPLQIEPVKNDNG